MDHDLYNRGSNEAVSRSYPRSDPCSLAASLSSLFHGEFRPDVIMALNDPFREHLEAEFNQPDIVYVLLLCRLQFQKEKNAMLSYTTLCETRANYCEYFAVHMLRHQGKSVKGKLSQLAMARALVGGLHAFQGASEEVKHYSFHPSSLFSFEGQGH